MAVLEQRLLMKTLSLAQFNKMLERSREEKCRGAANVRDSVRAGITETSSMQL